MCVVSFEKTVQMGLGNFPTRGICITDTLLVTLVLGIMKQGRDTPLFLHIGNNTMELISMIW